MPAFAGPVDYGARSIGRLAPVGIIQNPVSAPGPADQRAQDQEVNLLTLGVSARDASTAALKRARDSSTEISYRVFTVDTCGTTELYR